MTARNLTGVLLDATETPVPGGVINAQLTDIHGTPVTGIITSGNGLVVPAKVRVYAEDDGTFALPLVPNIREEGGEQVPNMLAPAARYVISGSRITDDAPLLHAFIQMPDQDTALSSLDQPIAPALSYQTAAAISAALSTGQAALSAAARADAEAERLLTEEAADSVLLDAGFQAVSTDLTGANTIGAVATISAEVVALADVTVEIAALGPRAADIAALAPREADLATLAPNVTAIQTAATNIAAIIAAPDEADAAAASATAAAASAATIDPKVVPTANRPPLARSNEALIESGWLPAFATLLPAYEAVPLGWYETGETVGTLKVIVNYDPALAIFGLGAEEAFLGSTEIYTTSLGTTLAEETDPLGLMIDGRFRLKRGDNIGPTAPFSEGFAAASGALTYPSGVATATAVSDGANMRLEYTAAVVAGRVYEVNVRVATTRAAGNAGNTLVAWAGVVTSPALTVSSGDGTFVDVRVFVEANASSMVMRFYVASSGGADTGDKVEISSLSVRERPGNHRTQSNSALRPLFISDATGEAVRHNLVDQKTTVTLPAITGGTLIWAGRDGTWVEEGWSFAGGTLDIGPTTIAGLPDGVGFAIGEDEVGLTIVDRALTEAEIVREVERYKAMGAKGRLVEGPELYDPLNAILLGDVGLRSYDAGTDTYTVKREAGGFSTSGRVQFELPAGEYITRYTTTSVLPAADSLTITQRVGTTATVVPGSTAVGPGTHEFIVILTSVGVGFAFATSAANVEGTVSAISIRRLIPEEDL